MTWRSPMPLPDSAGRCVSDVAPNRHGRPDGAAALVDGPSGDVVTFEALAARIDAVAAGLAAHGFRRGDVLALWAANGPTWAVAALGAMRAGGTVTGVPSTATVPEARIQLSDAGAAVLVVDAARAADAAAAAEGTAVQRVVAMGEALELPGGRVPARAAADVALLPYSSGTTGLPKGVVLTHANLIAAVHQVGVGLGLCARDVVLAVPPFAHVMGFVVCLLAPLAAGATVVVMPRFDFEEALALVARHRVTVLPVPPPVVAALAHHPAVERHDLTSLELIVSGGAPLGADLHRAVASRFPHAKVGQGYGLTETAVGVTMPDRATGTPPGTVGRVMPGTELRVVDPTTWADLGPGEPGELWVRGPQVMAGYLHRPEATAEIFTRDGWLRTGDLAEVDADGTVAIVDRLKELIKVRGLQVAPAELEAVLLGHPHVADAAVIPRPDDRAGEVPIAVVVPRGGLDPDGLRAWVAERVAPHKRLAGVRIAERIPRTPAGKVLRRRLVEEDRGVVARG
jgi:acyl-CoA synthetase (AMP-forming)/AMP-acid ligase II